jgi:hypothetical protein
MKTFEQWLAERGARTRLGIYPSLYGSGAYPPLHAAPTSAGHLNAFVGVHGDEHPELLSEPIRKAHKAQKKSPQKNPWASSFDKTDK